MEWLRDLFGHVIDRNDKVKIECAVRASLFLLGFTLFCDKSPTQVLVTYLKLLCDLGIVQDYLWSATTLAYLYCQLGTVSRAGV